MPTPRSWRYLAFFVLLALLFRWGTSFLTVINHDESTYITIAGEMLRGKVYLRDLIDTKPIGIFWVYEALIILTGGSIVGLRLATTLVLAATAYLLYWTSLRAGLGAFAGGAAGAGVIVASSVFTYYGISPNSELFFNPLTVAAVGLAVAPRTVDPTGADPPRRQWFAAGILLGAAVIIKPFAAAESLGVGLFLLYYYWLRRREWAGGLASGVLLLSGFALPVLAVLAYYLHHDLLPEFFHYTFAVNRNYPVELVWYLRLKYLGDYLLRYAPFVLLAGAGLYAWFRSAKDHAWPYFLCGYGLLVTLMVLSPGKRFGHYQIQLHPVLMLLTACFFAPGISVWPRVRNALRSRTTVYVLLLIAAAIGTLHFFRYGGKRDRSAEIVAYLDDRLQPGEQYFSLNGFQITYYLLDRPVPTPYVHSSLLFYDHHIRAFQLDERAEAHRLLDNPDLRYLIRRPEEDLEGSLLVEELLPHFILSDTISEGLVVYERR